jgi:farnesyl diphosphate synthase
MPTTLKEFETVFPTLVNDMKEHCQQYKLPDQALNWFEQVRHSIAHQHIRGH